MAETKPTMDGDRRPEEDRATDLLAFLGDVPEPQSDLPAWLLPEVLRGGGAERDRDERRAA